MRALDPLTRTLRDPACATDLGPGEWDWLLRAARRAKLAAHLYYQLQDRDLLQHCPPRARDMLTAAQYYPTFLQVRARREVSAILRALGSDAPPLILLKGAAYIFCGYPLARGRHLSDVDILVPRAHLDRTEERLMAHGWEPQKLDSYDQRYYREWMHEIPPLKHPRRGMEVDIHHALLPITARLHPDPELLWDASVPLPDERLRVLAPPDMVLHSAAHLFYDGEIAGSLRDLVDLHQLFTQLGTDQTFWTSLIDRAKALELVRPLFYALHFCTRLLHTRVPEPVNARAAALGAPSKAGRLLMESLIDRALAPRLPGEAGSPRAAWLLYLRSHWLRMPPRLLASHLSRKTWRRFTGTDEGIGTGPV